MVRAVRRFIEVKQRGLIEASDPAPVHSEEMTATETADPAEILDIFDDGSMATAVGRARERIVPAPGPGIALDAELMAQAMIDLLRRLPSVRARFPHALGEGASGGFGSWMKGEGLGLLEVDQDHAKLIDSAFAADFGALARQRLLYDPELRGKDHLFLLPNGRRSACRVLFDANEHDSLSLTSIWWFLLAAAEDPLRELHTTWAITPSWQAAVPAGGSVFGTIALVRWVAATYGIEQDWIFSQDVHAPSSPAAQMRLAYNANPVWRATFPHALGDADHAAAMLVELSSSRDHQVSFLARAWLAEQDLDALATEMSRPGINILGHLSYPSGLRVSTKSLIEGLHVNDIATSVRDVPVDLAFDEPVGHAFCGCEIYDVTIIHLQPTPFFDHVYERARLHPKESSTYRIAFWYWELDEIPSSWDRLAFECDEIWTATRFVADGLRRRYKQPVNVFPPGVEVPMVISLSRRDFGIDQNAFVFVFVFHMRSGMERKNPIGLIKAFKTAFLSSENVQLVVKLMSGMGVPDDFAQLKAEAAGANILVIDETYSHEKTMSLVACCDAYVSLHRSEGFGLTMAEAMLLGRPVIATRYSGNLEFMDDSNSILVDCELVILNETIPPYEAGQKWAEPSISHAASCMRRLYDDPVAAAELGARARDDIGRRLNFEATGANMKARLTEIRGGKIIRGLSNQPI